MDEATLVGQRVREVRKWRKLSLREAAGLAGLSFSHGAYVRLPQQRREVLVRLINTYDSVVSTAKFLGGCGLSSLAAARAAGAQADQDTMATHLNEASTLAARLGTEVGTWAHLWFGPTNVGIWKTSIALEFREYGHAVQAARTVRPELLPGRLRQAGFWAEVGRALAVEKKTRGSTRSVMLRSPRRSES